MTPESTTDARRLAAAAIESALASGATALDESQSKALFGAYGIPVPGSETAKTAVEAVAAAGRLSGKVVMKGVASAIHHKTEAGLVLLNIEGAQAVEEGFRLLEERAQGKLEGVLVEQMITSNREFMVGMKRDPVFGPVVAFGLGGVLTEALGDVVLALAPVGDARRATDARPHQGEEATRRLQGLSASGSESAGPHSPGHRADGIGQPRDSRDRRQPGDGSG